MAQDLSTKLANKDIQGRGLSKENLTTDLLNKLSQLKNPTIAEIYYMPSELGWDNVNFNLGEIGMRDVPGYNRNTGYIEKTPEQLFDAHSTARSAPTVVYYVNGATGNDANSGLSPALPFRAISTAVTAANAGGVPVTIFVAAGIYHKTINPTYLIGGGNVRPTVDIAFIATGGRVVTGCFEGPGSVSYVIDNTYVNCYSATLTGGDLFERVLDINSYNSFGNWNEFIYVGTPDLCNITPNSWTNVGVKIYINRGDKQVVSASNTRLYRAGAYTFRLFDNNVSIYIGGEGASGFDFEGGGVQNPDGGNGGVLNVNIGTPGTTLEAFVVKNCSFKYGGGKVNTTNIGVKIDCFNGIAAFFNCRSDANQTDGFNVHQTRSTNKSLLLTVNCTGYDNGRLGNVSCNGWTIHDQVVGIDIAGFYNLNRGGTFRNINNARIWGLGTFVKDDLGDRRSNGGSLDPTAFMTDDTAICWLENCKADMPASTYTYYANTGSIIHKRNCWDNGQPNAGPGVIDSF